MDGIEMGLRSTHDLGNYALIHDPYGPEGKKKEHPGFMGDDFFLAASPESIMYKADMAAPFSSSCYYNVAKNGKVYGDAYHDAESNRNLIPVHFANPLGIGVLGSEVGYYPGQVLQTIILARVIGRRMSKAGLDKADRQG